MVEDTTPLSVSLNDQGHSGLCLKAHFDDFPYFYHRWVVTVFNGVVIVLKVVVIVLKGIVIVLKGVVIVLKEIVIV